MVPTNQQTTSPHGQTSTTVSVTKGRTQGDPFSVQGDTNQQISGGLVDDGERNHGGPDTMQPFPKDQALFTRPRQGRTATTDTTGSRRTSQVSNMQPGVYNVTEIIAGDQAVGNSPDHGTNN